MNTDHRTRGAFGRGAAVAAVAVGFGLAIASRSVAVPLALGGLCSLAMLRGSFKEQLPCWVALWLS